MNDDADLSIDDFEADNFEEEEIDTEKGLEEVNRYYEARDPDVSIERLRELSTHWSPMVRGSVGKNPKTPLDVLFRLAKSKHRKVLIGVGTNPNCPREIFLQLTQEEDRYVKRQCIYYGFVPFDILLMFMENESPETRNQALNSLLRRIQNDESLSKEDLTLLLEHKNPVFRANLTSRQDLSEETWLRLVSEETVIIQYSILTKKHTPQQYIDMILEKRVDGLLLSLASHSSLSVYLYEYIMKHGSIAAQVQLLRNPSVPFSCVRSLSAVAELRSNVRRCKKEFIMRSNTSVELLEELAVDSDLFVRKFLAMQLSIPDSVVDILAQDTHKGVGKELAKSREEIQRRRDEQHERSQRDPEKLHAQGLKEGSLLAQDISILELSNRTERALRMNHITYVYQLVQKTKKDVLLLRLFGRKSFNEVIDILGEHNLSLKDDLF